MSIHTDKGIIRDAIQAAKAEIAPSQTDLEKRVGRKLLRELRRLRDMPGSKFDFNLVAVRGSASEVEVQTTVPGEREGYMTKMLVMPERNRIAIVEIEPHWGGPQNLYEPTVFQENSNRKTGQKAFQYIVKSAALHRLVPLKP
jgi:hypothetical protein